MGRLRADAKTREHIRKKKQQEEMERKAKRNLQILKWGAVLLLGAGFITICFQASKEVRRNRTLYTGEILWDELKVDKDLISTEGIEKIDGTIGFDAYLNERRAQEVESINKIKPVVTDAMYKNMMDGLDSQYYYDSVQADYNIICTSISDLVEESQWIKALYDAYEKDIGIGSYDTTECLGLAEGEKTCDLKEIIQTYTTGELKEYLMDAHDKWESLTNYRKEKVDITDSYMELLYQDSIVTDVTTIKNLEGDVYVVGKDLYDKGPDKITKSMTDGKIQSVLFTENTKDSALEQLKLYNDINYFDGDFKLVTADTITALFAGDATVDNVEYLGENLTESELVEALKNKEQLAENNEGTVELGDLAKALSEKSGGTSDIATPSVADAKENAQMSTLNGYVPLTFSLTGYDERDVYYIFFKVNDIEHDMGKVETYNSMKPILEERAKAVEAQKDISAIISAEMNDLQITDAETLREYFPEFAITDAEYNAQLEKLEGGNSSVSEIVKGAEEQSNEQSGQANGQEEEVTEQATDTDTDVDQ